MKMMKDKESWLKDCIEFPNKGYLYGATPKDREALISFSEEVPLQNYSDWEEDKELDAMVSEIPSCLLDDQQSRDKFVKDNGAELLLE